MIGGLFSKKSDDIYAGLEWLPSSKNEILSYGPVSVWTTKDAKERPAGSDSKFEIIHGWTPLMLSTAKCFTRLISSNVAPICVPFIWTMVVTSGSVTIYTKSLDFNLISDDSDKSVIYEKASEKDLPINKAIANVFMADMRSFNESVELRVSDKAIILNSYVEKIVLKPTAKLTVYQYA